MVVANADPQPGVLLAARLWAVTYLEPCPPSPLPLRSRGVPRPPRLPVHLYMTQAIRGRLASLDAQYSRLVETLTLSQQQSGATPELPEPQVITVGLSGRILTAAHIKVRTRCWVVGEALLPLCCLLLPPCCGAELANMIIFHPSFACSFV